MEIQQAAGGNPQNCILDKYPHNKNLGKHHERFTKWLWHTRRKGLKRMTIGFALPLPSALESRQYRADRARQYRSGRVQAIQSRQRPGNAELGIRGNREPGVPPVQKPNVSCVVGSSG